MEQPFDKDMPHANDMLALFKFLDASDDRVLAIVCASYCETYIADLIQTRMPGISAKLRKKLFDADGLLGPAMARFDIARALNVIDPVFHNDLKTLASIRNKFAHNISIDSFDHPEIANRMDKLQGKIGLANATEEDQKKHQDWLNSLSRRGYFLMHASHMCTVLHNIINDIKLAAHR